MHTDVPLASAKETEAQLSFDDVLSSLVPDEIVKASETSLSAEQIRAKIGTIAKYYNLAREAIVNGVAQEGRIENRSNLKNGEFVIFTPHSKGSTEILKRVLEQLGDEKGLKRDNPAVTQRPTILRTNIGSNDINHIIVYSVLPKSETITGPNGDTWQFAHGTGIGIDTEGKPYTQEALSLIRTTTTPTPTSPPPPTA